jgi:transposase
LNWLKAQLHFANKVSMRPKGTKTQLEVRRRVAVSLLETGWGVRQVARHVHASPSSVRRWRAAVVQYAAVGLDAKPHPGGSQPKLPASQRQQLVDLLRQGARAHGFRNELWTLAWIAAVIEHHFALPYCPAGIWHLLRHLGWSPQKPATRARERDEDAIANWRTDQWPKLQKSPA